MRRRILNTATVLGIVGAVLLLAHDSPDAQRRSRLNRETVNGRDVVAREVLVRFHEPAGPRGPETLGRDADVETLQQVSRAGIFRIRSRSLDVPTLIDRFVNRPDVAYAEPNFVVQIQTTPNDPHYPSLWGLEKIQAPAAWDLTTGSTSHVVAIVDTGVDYTHDDLMANIWSAPAAFTVNVGGRLITCAAGTHGFNAIDGTCDPMDDHSHGTHVAGTIGAAGNNAIGVAGVNWTARLLALKFLDSTGSGTMADAITSMEFAMAVKQAFAATGAANIRVLSNSWGGTDSSQALRDQIHLAGDSEMLFVAAAGNTGTNNDSLPLYPASYDAPNIVSVAATTTTDALAWFSNYGAVSVDLAAPGDFILSTTPGGNYGYKSGTSMAAPHVSGAASLLLSHCEVDTVALKGALLGTADPIAALGGRVVTGGRLNVNSALHACSTAPQVPTGLEARAGNAQVTLSWSPSLGALRYNVKRSPASGGPYSMIAAGMAGTSHTDGGVTNGTAYYYVVSAENTLGESGNSNEATATPNIPPDLVVSSLSVPAIAGAGVVISLSATTRNQGTGTAAASTTKLFLSKNTVVDPSDATLAVAQDVPALVPGASASASLAVTIPSGTATGTYYLIAGADGEDLLGESSETNNLAWSAVRIGPDLLLSGVTAPSATAAGSVISVTDTVSNQGGGSAPATTAVFYLSADGSIGQGDVVLGSRVVPALGAGTSSPAVTALTISSSTSAGAYYILARADATDSLVETREYNNIASRLIKIGGDLIVSAFTVPAVAEPGSSIAVSDTVRNQGADVVTPSITRFYLSANALLDGGDVELSGSRTVGALGIGVSSTGSTTVMIPAAVVSGSYYVIAQADADDTVPETSGTNNTLARSLKIGGDLVISTLTVPATAAPGAAVIVSDTIANQGSGDVPASVTRFYLSLNSSWDGNDVVLGGARPIPGLGAGAVSAGSTSVTLPASVTTGTYYVIAKADADGAAAESNEDNNTASRQIRIGGDVVVSTFTAPLRAGAGMLITLGDTTTNQGAATVAPTMTRFYLSGNGTLDAADTLLGGRPVPSLAPGIGNSGSTTVTIPAAIVVGTFYVIAKADADESEGETLETNNTTVRTIAIGPDLTVPSISVSAGSAPAGGTVTVTDTVTNAGAGSAAASVTRYFLSPNLGFGPDDIELTGAREIAALDAGGSSSGTTVLTIPAATAPGGYFLLVVTDADRVVVETSETNNVRSRWIQVTAAQ